jgi:Flp pilus assembly pilin Flp
VTDAQGWTLLAMVGVLLSVIGALIVNQFHLLRGYLDARFEAADSRHVGLESAFSTRFTALETSLDARFEGVNSRLDHLDRDVQALFRDRFGRE